MRLLPPPMRNRKTFTPASSFLSLTSMFYASALVCWEMVCI
jgi:hypothetical protein